MTRIGPSPTGMMHIGTLYVGLLNSILAKQTGGVSVLRIEDTDKKRQIDGAVDFIMRSLDRYQISFDEGPHKDGSQPNNYGPYTQSARADTYASFIKSLLEQGKAYPCFCSPAELDSIRSEQEKSSARTGYYASWANWRDKSHADVNHALDQGLPYVIRLRATGSHQRKIRFHDLVFGTREMAENDHDIVIMKADGLPTYHFAHVVDDHLMGTTHVIRGDEWLASVPTHLQLFEALTWTPPAYAHVAPINKIDGPARRKLSKRKDLEASVSFFATQGYPEEAVLEYLMSLADADFEAWRIVNPDAALDTFPLSIDKRLGGGGPLFDFDKLQFVSKNVMSRMSAEDIFTRGLAWAKTHDVALANQMMNAPDYTRAALSIERGGPNARKDIFRWADLALELVYFYDDLFDLGRDTVMDDLGHAKQVNLISITDAFAATYDTNDDRNVWFNKLKQVAADNGFAIRPKDYKNNPDAFKGTVADIARIFRILLTGRPTSPDLYATMQVMGPDRVRRRIKLK